VAAPLNPNPVGQMERILNELRVKYRTYLVPFDREQVSLFVSLIHFAGYFDLLLFVNCLFIVVGHGYASKPVCT
jgi:hypothetical protein